MSPETMPETKAEPTLERRVLSGTGLQLAARVATALCSASAMVAIGRSIGTERYGAWSFYFSFFLIAASLVDFGSTTIAVRDCSREPQREAAILRAIFRLRVVGSAAAVLLLVAVAWLREGSWRGALLPSIAALHLLALAPGTAGTWLHVHVRLFWVALASAIGIALYFGLVLLLARLGVRDFGVYLLAFAVGTAVQSLVPWIAVATRVHLLGPVEPGLPSRLLREMAPLGFSGAMSTFYFRCDTLLLTWIVGEEAAGRYQHTFPLLSFSIALPSYLCAALMPVFSRAAARGAGELLVLVRRTAAVLASVAFPAAAMAPFVGGLLLEAIWKPGTVSEATRRCVPLLAIAGVAIFLTYPQMHALTALGRQRVLAWITFGSGLLKLGVSWLCIERGGIEGAALATAITELSVLGWVSFELRRAAHRTAFSRALVRPLATSAIAAGVALGLSGTTPAIATAATVVVLLFAVAMGGALPLRLEDLR